MAWCAARRACCDHIAGHRVQPMTTRKTIVISSLTLLSLAGLVVAALYLWPLHSQTLKNTHIQTYTYDQDVALVQRHIQDEMHNPALTPECHSLLLVHGHKTARAVVMFPGYPNCPTQFGELARFYYDRGYNVYVPLAPKFGTRDERGHAEVTATELVDYANQAVNLTSGLGEEVGTVGLSGGGVLSTWSALFRNDTVKRALILSPFYEPHPSQLSKWLLKPFAILFGFRILPDRFTADQASYHALAQYVLIAANLEAEKRPHLTAATLVLASGDDQVDHDVATAVVNRLFDHPVIYLPPAEWGLKHDIVDHTGADINGHAPDLYPRYVQLYEGRPVP